jgi:hypothetical protein
VNLAQIESEYARLRARLARLGWISQGYVQDLSCNIQNRNSVWGQNQTALCGQKWTGYQKTGQWSRTRGWALGSGAWWR